MAGKAQEQSKGSAQQRQTAAARKQRGSAQGLEQEAKRQAEELAQRQAAREQALAERLRVAEGKKAAAGEKAQLAKRGFQLNEEQREFARSAALRGAVIADVKRVLADELVSSGAWQQSDASNGAELNEALYRALRQEMRAAQREAASEEVAAA